MFLKYDAWGRDTNIARGDGVSEIVVVGEDERVEELIGLLKDCLQGKDSLGLTVGSNRRHFVDKNVMGQWIQVAARLKHYWHRPSY